MDEHTRSEILDLIAKYSYGYDDADWEMYRSIWAVDATLTTAGPGSELRTPSVIVEHGKEVREQRAAAGRQPRHYTTNTLLAEAADGRVTGRTMLLIVAQARGEAVPTPVRTGVYHDEFVKTPVGWRFASRELHLDQG